MNQTNSLNRQLEAIKGKTFQYGNKIHYVIDFSIDEVRQKVVIKSNLEVFERNFESIPEFLKYWKECNSITVPALTEEPDKAMVFYEQQTTQADELIDILKDNIERVRQNKEYIPQAQAINNNVNTIVNIAKMKMNFAQQKRRK